MIYFDHNATTPVDERVLDAMLPFLTTFYGNPSSLYRIGRVVRSAIDVAREQVAALVDVSPSQLIFTSGGTEANNLAVNAVGSMTNIVVSAIEHPSVIEPFNNNGFKRCFTLPVNEHGLISLSVLDDVTLHTDTPTLYSIMLANNETGVIQDISSFVQKIKEKKNVIHTDAIQAVGKIPVSFKQLGVDLLSISSHKIYGPKGCGALVLEKDLAFQPLMKGGGQERGLRAGTENVAAIIGFGKAAELAMLELEQRSEYLSNLKNELENKLSAIPGLVIFSQQVERLPNTIQFGIPGVDGEMLLMQLDQNNIAVSSGSACISGGGKASAVLTAMAVDYNLAKSAIRISLGKANTMGEINQFIKVLKSLVLKGE